MGKIKHFRLPFREKKGRVYYRHQCKSCYYGIYQKDQKQARIRLFIEYKMTCKCERCGENDWRALQFHHTGDLLKENSIAAMVGRWDHKKVMDEIASVFVSVQIGIRLSIVHMI